MKICTICQQTYSDDIEFCPRDGARLATKAPETEAQLAAGLSRRFRIVRRLGQGGMGTVFLAEQIGVGNRPVALKVLNRKLLDDPEFLLRFQNEAASTGRIRHVNVVTVHESGQADDGTPYIAMEFLEGQSLRDALGRGPLTVAECSEILMQAARGLNSAHKLGMIHRDLKPDNIFLTHGDEGELIVKIVDFGIAKLRESATHTLTGMVLGTPAYMSSEQAFGMPSDELDARSDVYSLGIVVYEMLSGRVPFHSVTPLGYLRKHMLDAPPPFRAVAPGLSVPPQVERVVLKALTKMREERYATALEFARDFVRAASAASQAEPSNLAPTERGDSVTRDRAEDGLLTHERVEAERREREKAAAELAARVKAQQEQLAHEKAEAERRETEKAAAELAARVKAQQEQLAREKAEAERRETEKAAAELAAREKAHQEQLAREKAEAERRETEKAAAELAAREKAHQEQLAREKAEAERRETEKAAAELAAREKAHQEQLAREKAEAERRETEKAAAELAAREKAHQEQLAREKAEAERREREKAAAELAAREKAHQEQLAREKAEAERREREKAAAELAAREKAVSMVSSLIPRNPPPGPPERTVETPSAQPQTSKPAPAAYSPPAAPRAPQFRAAAETPSPVKYVVLGLVLLAVIVGGIWYFSPSAPKSTPNVTGPPSVSSNSAPAPEVAALPAGMVSIPGATFTMGRDNAGDPEETPAHSVNVAAFNLDKKPVTNAQYAEFIKSSLHAAPSGWATGTYLDAQAEWPVTGVSWDDANAYCTSRGLRLPTEAEWEYAARGTDGRLYPWGNSFSSAFVNSLEAGLGNPEPVGIRPGDVSPFSVLDMSGNVWEWTADAYRPYPGHQAAFAIPVDAKVIRGGSYQSDKLHVTTTTRNLDHASTRSPTIGFRCAK